MTRSAHDLEEGFLENIDESHGEEKKSYKKKLAIGVLTVATIAGMAAVAYAGSVSESKESGNNCSAVSENVTAMSIVNSTVSMMTSTCEDLLCKTGMKELLNFTGQYFMGLCRLYMNATECAQGVMSSDQRVLGFVRGACNGTTIFSSSSSSNAGYNDIYSTGYVTDTGQTNTLSISRT